MNIIQRIERAIESKPDISIESFASRIGTTRQMLAYKLKTEHGTTWTGIRKKTKVESRPKRCIRLIRELATNPEVKTLYQACERIGESYQYTKMVLSRHQLSWRAMCEDQDKISKEETARASGLIIIPESLLMPLRSYRHCKAVYSNTEARL